MSIVHPRTRYVRDLRGWHVVYPSCQTCGEVILEPVACATRSSGRRQKYRHLKCARRVGLLRLGLLQRFKSYLSGLARKVGLL